MPVRRLRALAVALAGAIIATGLSVLVSSPALALDAPGNPSPSGPQTGIPTFSWDRVAGATTYDFQISTSDQFNSTLVDVTTVQHQYVPRIQLPTGTQLYWRVRASGGGEAWTTTLFSRNTTGAPTLIGPADGVELTQPDSPVTLSWQPVAGAESYDVQYGTDPNFVDQTATTNVKSSSFVVPLQTPGTYVWRVRGVLANGVFTAWSGGTSPLPPARTYQVMGLANSSSIPPTYPPDDINNAITDVVLDWEPIKGANSYQIQISTDQLFPPGTIVDQQTPIYGTRYSPPKTLNNDQYFWRIRATDAAGFQPDWATRPVWRFKRTWPDQPTLLYPQNNAIDVPTPFYFQWTPVKHASEYVVQIAPAGGSFPTPAPFDPPCTTTHTTLVYGEVSGNCWPTTKGVYQWRVTARDEFSANPPITDGISAAIGTFSYSPPMVDIAGPANGTHFSNTYGDDVSLGGPTLSWNAVAGAEKYRVTISGATTTNTYTTAALSFAPRYLDAGTYHWDVQTVDRLGSVGGSTLPANQRWFVVDPLPMVPDPNNPGQFMVKPVPTPLPGSGAPVPVSANLGSSYRFPSLKWSPVTWVSRYNIFITKPGGSTVQIPGDFSWNAGDDLTGTFLNPGTYSWYVVATRNDGSTLTGSTSQFTIMSLPDIPIESYKAALNGNALTGNLDGQTDTCNLKLPSNCQNLRATPVLGWDKPNDYVGYYTLVFSRDAELTNIISGPRDQANTMYLDQDAIPDSQAGSAYFVVILPCTADGHCSSLTHATHSFNKLTRPATLVSPAHGALVQNDVTLTWDDYVDSQRVVDGVADPDLSTPLDSPGEDEAAYYNVQTASDQNFTANVTTNSVDQTTFTSFGDTYPEGTTWWRVQAVDRNNNFLAWSAPRSFLKQSPTPGLLLPADGDTVPGDYTLSWTAQPFAATYDIEVYKGGDTSGNTVNRVINASTDRVQYVLTNLDPSSGPYAWRVRRHDGRNRPGGWSAFRTFNVTRPGVSLISPVDNDSTVPPSDQLFSWQPTTGATWYRFERRPGTTGGATEVVDTPTTKWAPTSAIAGGNWQWRVTAYDPAGNLIADSSWLHPFSVTDTPVASVPVSITGSVAVDSTLTLNPAQWNMPNNVLDITYQWLRDGQPVADATGLTYNVTATDVGRAIQVRATATRPGYRTGTSTSAPVNGTLAGAPQATVPVTIAGSGAFGTVLTLTAPTWDQPGTTTTYQWFRDANQVNGQTGPTYTVGTDDVGKTITVRATGAKAGYTDGTSTSNGIVASQAAAVAPTRAPSITGTSAARETLSVDKGDWPGSGEKRFDYQWFVDGVAVARETGDRYTVRTRDAGLSVSVRVTMTMTGFAPSVANTAAVPVAKLASKTTATTAARKITQRDRAVLDIFVEMFGYDAEMGTVKVMDGKKVIASPKLKAGGDGHIQLRLKKLKLGKHKLVVTYSGSAATVSSQAKPVVIKVVKGTV